MSELSQETKALLEKAREARLPSSERLAPTHQELQEKLEHHEARSGLLLLSPARLAVTAVVLCLLATSSVAAFEIIRHFVTSPEVTTRDESATSVDAPSQETPPQPRSAKRRATSPATPPPPVEDEVDTIEEGDEVEEAILNNEKGGRSRYDRQELRPTPPVSVETLVEETRLLNKAQGALRSREPRRALQILDEHGQRFPQGRLSHERDAARLVARCQLGPSDALRAQAERFVDRHPDSIYAARIRGACLR